MTPRSLARLVATAALAAAGLALAGCNESDLDPMMRQTKYLPYQESDLFVDGRAMRTPPANTVPRERKLGDALYLTGAQYPEYYADDPPMPVTRDLLLKGKKRFEIVCATCHGILGDGEAIPSMNMSLRPAPSLHLDAALARTRQPTPSGNPDRLKKSGWIFEVITNGYGIMPPFGAEIPVEERWAVASYIRALQLSQLAHVEDVPEAERQKLLAEGSK